MSAEAVVSAPEQNLNLVSEPLAEEPKPVENEVPEEIVEDEKPVGDQVVEGENITIDDKSPEEQAVEEDKTISEEKTAEDQVVEEPLQENEPTQDIDPTNVEDQKDEDIEEDEKPEIDEVPENDDSSDDEEFLLPEAEKDDDEKSFMLEDVETEQPTEIPKPRKKKRRKVRKASGDDIETLHFIDDKIDIEGDFTTLETEKKSFSSIITEGDEEYEDEEILLEDQKIEEAKVEQVVRLTEEERNELYEEFEHLEKDFQEERIKNNFLVKKLTTYYQKRHMDHVLQESKSALDTNRKYEKLLDDFEIFSKQYQVEVEAKKDEMHSLRSAYDAQQKEVEDYFKKFQRLEYDLGKEIISSEAGKKYDEKFIDRYLKRQKIQQGNLTKIRLDYIKIQSKMNEVQNALSAIDNLGPDLRLMDYEQLKHDNRMLKDKVEEKELELTLVRKKCKNSAQILAHRREKTAALDVDIEGLKEEFGEVSGELDDIRGQITMVKQERDGVRQQTEKLRLAGGLLFENKLLEDFSRTINEKEEVIQKLQEVQDTYQKICARLTKVRANRYSHRFSSSMNEEDDKRGSRTNMSCNGSGDSPTF